MSHVAVKSHKSAYYKKKYELLVKRRDQKRAIIAIAHMILTATYQMLSTGETWNLSDLCKIDMPQALVDKQKPKAIKQAKKLLQQEGIIPFDEPIASCSTFFHTTLLLFLLDLLLINFIITLINFL